MDTPNFFSNLRSHRLTSAFTLLTILTAGILTGSVLTHDVGARERQKVDTSDARKLVIPDPKTLSNAFSQIVKADGPAVVNINTETIPKKSALIPKGRRNGRNADPDGGSGDPNDMQDLFNRFFGQQGGGQGDEDDSGGRESQALGSGFIVDPRGYIITNNHVIDKADKIYVKLAGDPDDGTRLQGRPATVVGFDTETDIAVIKIDTKTDLPTIKLGNSDSAEVGDWVLAIGSPFGLSQTVSAGIVSAKNRSIDDRDASGLTKQFQKFIQTDAAINPGNSGGPLVDMDGKVVGMNTAIYTQSMGSQGVGFAMPSNVLAKVYNDLIGPQHKVIRGSIGIQFQASTSTAVSRMYGFSSGGVMVSEVTPGKGADKAGLKPEDVLVSINGRQIKDGDDLVADISARPVGSTVEIGYLRGHPSVKHTTSVTIGDRAEISSSVSRNDNSPEPPAPVDAGQTMLGISVTAIPSNVATKLGIQGGVSVTSVTPGSFADDIGLGKGALIIEINRQPVTDENAYRGIVSKLKAGDDVVFVVRDPRSKSSSYVGGTLR
jgi:serine protease Do